MIIGMALLLLFLPMAFAWDTNPSTNLIAHWALDTNATGAIDSHGGTYNGTNTGTLLNLGIINNGYRMNSGSEVNFGASSDLYFPGEVTSSIWIKTTSTTKNVIGKQSSHYAFWNWLFILDGTGKAVFYNNRIVGVGSVSTAGTINDGAWHNLVGKANSTGLYIYVDGVQSGFVANANAVSALDTTYTAAAYASDSNIDEISLWNRALSATDIGLLYNGGVGVPFCSSTGYFEVCPPSRLRINVKDETTWADLNNVTASIGSTSYTINTPNFDINLALVPAGAQTIYFTKDGYVTRSYYFINDGRLFDVNLLLETESLSVTLKVKVPGQNLYATDTNIQLDKNNWTIGTYYSNNLGETTVNIDANDQNYITRFHSDTNIYTINAVKLTVKQPADEISGSVIFGNYNLSVTNTYNYYYGNIIGDINLYILPNITDYVFIAVDSNNVLYANRTYFKQYDSDDVNDVLQPYLPLITDVGSYITFITKTKTRDTIKYVDFLVYKIINGTQTQIMSGRTDVTGSRYFPFIIGENYSIDVIKDGVIYETSYLYTATDSPVYWYIDLGTNDVNIEQYFIPTNITFTPNGPKLLGTDTLISVRMVADNIASYNYRIYQYHDINMLTGISIKSTGNGVCAGDLCIASVLIPSVDTNKAFYLDFNMNYDGNITKNTIRMYTKTVSSSLDIFRLALAVRTDFGCSTDPNYPCILGLIISSVLSAVFAFIIGKMVGLFSGLGSLVLFMMALGIFTLAGWFYWPLYIFLLAGGILASAGGFATKGDQ
jgi:hypothetical protein